jgi:hypothetical protein
VAEGSEFRAYHARIWSLSSEISPESATGWRKQQAENRFGVTHLLQFGDRLKC